MESSFANPVIFRFQPDRFRKRSPNKAPVVDRDARSSFKESRINSFTRCFHRSYWLNQCCQTSLRRCVGIGQFRGFWREVGSLGRVSLRKIWRSHPPKKKERDSIQNPSVAKTISFSKTIQSKTEVHEHCQTISFGVTPFHIIIQPSRPLGPYADRHSANTNCFKIYHVPSLSFTSNFKILKKSKQKHNQTTRANLFRSPGLSSPILILFFFLLAFIPSSSPCIPSSAKKVL